MGKIILIRHGQSKLNIKNVYYGNLDPDLTETGIEQANKTKQILKNYDYDAIYSSDLKRALKTAQIINYNNIEIQTSKDLRELNFGIFEGLTYDEIVKKYPDEIVKSENDWKNYNYISGENVFQLQKRVINFLNKTIDFNKNNIIVSHWGVINTILSHYFSNELESYWKYSVNNGGIVILEFHDGYPIMKGFNIGGKMELLKNFINQIEDVDFSAMNICEEILNTRMKPKKSLGVLEELAIKVAGITRKPLNTLENGTHIIISADNGIIQEGVSSCPLEYTRIVSEAMLSSHAAIGILCDSLKIPITLIDIGIDGDINRKYDNLLIKKIRRSTRNFAIEPAMTEKEMLEAIFIGISTIKERHSFDFFSNGEMGIANTTTSSAILYALTKENLNSVVGRGGGLSDDGLKRKKHIIAMACKKYELFDKTPLEILQTVGGFDIACMVGLYLGAGIYKKPILIDGFISAVAALVAIKIEPKLKGYLIATHMSEEPGMKIVMQHLGLHSFLNMKMRLGEGTGAVLAYPILKAAMEIPKKMMTPNDIYKLLK